MTHSVVALFHSPWPQAGMARPDRGDARALYRYAVWYKANPRGVEYMRDLVAGHFPEATWVNTAESEDWRQRIAVADQIVLLYPDAIGMGFSPIERDLIAHKLAWAGVTVLNGRSRRFRLNGGTHMGLRLRRFLAWTMLPEMLFLPVFVLATPVLWGLDLMRGRV